MDPIKTERREWYLEMQGRVLEKAQAENKLLGGGSEGGLMEEEWPSVKAERLRKEAEYAEALLNYQRNPNKFKRPKELGKDILLK